MDETYDVIVVGAGPGGSIAARDCAAAGLKTLVVEKRQEVGSPVRCGEGLGEVWVKKAGLEYDPAWCLHESHGAMVYTPSGRKIEIRTKNKGWVIERKVFEKKLAADAIRAGAKFLVKTRVYDVIREKRKTGAGEEEFVAGVRTEGPDGNKDFFSKIVIACDGVDSKTGRYAGIQTFNPGTEVDSGYEYEMAGVECPPDDLIHLFVGHEIAPRGYVWIFYKSKDVANVGIGISGVQNNDGTSTAKHYLDAFIAAHPEYFKHASAYEAKGGCIPVGAPLEKPYGNGIVLVGDAAHMVNPIHGGGMGTAMEAARIAARVVKKAIDTGDLSENVFKEYYDEWMGLRGKQMLEVLKVRRFFERLSDEDMEKLADVFTPQALLEFSDGQKIKAFAKLFVKSPKLALLAAATLK